jgi:hypothetical protein
MIPFKAGDIVPVEFPFSDFQTYKRRPGLVLAGGEMDLPVARLTTYPPREPSDIAMKCWSETGLPRASTIRLAKLATIVHWLLHHKIGRCRKNIRDFWRWYGFRRRSASRPGSQRMAMKMALKIKSVHRQMDALRTEAVRAPAKLYRRRNSRRLILTVNPSRPSGSDHTRAPRRGLR